MNWYLGVLKKYAVFEGRAQRTELWVFLLFNFLVNLLLWIFESVVGSPRILETLYSLGVLVPSLAVGARRLHDTNRTGWWLLVGLIPVVGAIVLLVFFVMDGDHGANEYGPNPKATASA